MPPDSPADFKMENTGREGALGFNTGGRDVVVSHGGQSEKASDLLREIVGKLGYFYMEDKFFLINNHFK